MTSQSVPASSAAPAQPTFTAAQLEENITRRLMEVMSTKLEQLVIQQTAQTQQSPQQIPQQRQQQPRPQQQTEQAAPDEGQEDTKSINITVKCGMINHLPITLETIFAII